MQLCVNNFDCNEIYDWLKENCWSNRDETGQCCHTAQFIEIVFGLKAIAGSYHCWNLSCENKVLDLTVKQFGFDHFSKFVKLDTIFDKNPVNNYKESKKHLIGKTRGYKWAEKFENDVKYAKFTIKKDMKV